MGQRFYADPDHTFAFTNGAVGYRSGATFDVLGPYAKVRNCPVVAYGAERARLTCYATGYADTYFSVPACTRFRGRYVRGYFAVDNDAIEFRVMDSHRDLFAGVELQARRSVIQVSPVAVAAPLHYVIAVGTPADGFHYVGPFHDAELANNYADIECSNSDWWVITLQSPDASIVAGLQS